MLWKFLQGWLWIIALYWPVFAGAWVGQIAVWITNGASLRASVPAIILAVLGLPLWAELLGFINLVAR